MPSAWRIAEINEREVIESGTVTLPSLGKTRNTDIAGVIENNQNDVCNRLEEAILQARLELKLRKKREIKGGRAEILNQCIKQLKTRLCHLRSYQSKLNRINDFSIESQHYLLDKVMQYLKRI